MYRTWTLCVAVLAIAGCDSGANVPAGPEGERTDRVSGTYRVEQRCNGLGAAAVDFTPRGQGGNYHLLVRGDGETVTYAAVDRLELSPSWNNDNSAIKTASDGLPLYRWNARLTKEPGWLKNAEGRIELPDEASVAYDSDNDRFFFESVCGEQARAPNHTYQHATSRLVLRELNVALANARDRLYRDAGQRYIDQRRDYQGGSGAGGVTEGHHDRNQHLLNVAALMEADATDKVPGLARLVTEHRPADAADAQRYQQELPAYLRAAARAHARWYIDAADIRLDWFHGAYPDGEAAIHEGMAKLEDAYFRLAGQ